jgi:hypothetical protein
MASKISDFKMAGSIIKKMCRKQNVVFVNVSLSFEDPIEGTLFIGETKNISHTIFKIVSEYISNSMSIIGSQLMPDEKDREEFLIVLASNLRNFMYGDDSSDTFVDESHIVRLYQYPLVWILLKDIICPIYNKEMINLKVINASHPQIDIAKYYSLEEVVSEEISDEEFIFINDINNRVLQLSSLFLESLKAYGLSPIEVIQGIYESDVYEKYHGLLEIALADDDEIRDFECSVMESLGVNFYSLISDKVAFISSKFMKTAQNSVPGLPNQFWQLGLLEKMMEGRRGADWSVYMGLEPYVKEFWDKVEDVRQKRVENGHDDGVPFNTLLRIKERQTVDYKVDPNTTIQSLLSSNRVW